MKKKIWLAGILLCVCVLSWAVAFAVDEEATLIAVIAEPPEKMGNKMEQVYYFYTKNFVDGDGGGFGVIGYKNATGTLSMITGSSLIQNTEIQGWRLLLEFEDYDASWFYLDVTDYSFDKTRYMRPLDFTPEGQGTVYFAGEQWGYHKDEFLQRYNEFELHYYKEVPNMIFMLGESFPSGIGDQVIQSEVYYHFDDDNGLSKGLYVFPPKQFSSESEMVRVFHSLETMLMDIYGEPVMTTVDISEEMLTDNSILEGKAAYGARFAMLDTFISLELSGDGNSILFRIEYQPKDT